MDIKAIHLKQKFGTLYFYFTIGTIEYVFVLYQNLDLDKKGVLKNKKTGEQTFIDFSDEKLEQLLRIVDFWLESQKRMIQLEDEDNLFKNAKKDLIKDINLTKKYYYNIIKSNFKYAHNHRPKS